jgi:hypothetical protein
MAIDFKQRGCIPFWLLIVGLIYLTFRNEYRVYTLRKNGVKTVGYVYSVQLVGSKGTVRCFYRFSTPTGTNQGFYDSISVKEGDSLNIIYLPKTPDLNYAEAFVLKDFW